MLELLTVGTPDSQGIWKLAVGINTGHVWYDHHSELSKLVKVRDVRTHDHCWNSWPSELPMNQPENNNFTIAGQIPDTSGIARPARNQLALLSLKYSKLTWVGLSTYETLSINMMHPS